MFHLAVVINYEKRARSAGHQQLLDGASAGDDVGDVLSLDGNSTFILRRRSQWASVPPFRPFQLLQVAPRFWKKRTSNWFYNFRRIKQLVKGPPVARVDRASAISAEGKRAKIMLFFAINDLESTQLERP